MSCARVTLALLAACIALALAGCGGDDEDEQTTATNGPRTEQQTTTQPPEGQPEANNAEEAEQADGQGAILDSAPEPGTKSAAPGVPVTPGGDNSIQTFGTEGEVDEREQAVATLQAYLRARAAGQWQAACEQTSEQFKQQLTVLVAGARAKEGAEKPEGCAETLRLFFGRTPQAQLGRDAQVRELLSFRVEERDGQEYAYVIYRGAGGKVRFIAMANDEGEWKVNTVQPEEFPSVEGLR